MILNILILLSEKQSRQKLHYEMSIKYDYNFHITVIKLKNPTRMYIVQHI